MNVYTIERSPLVVVVDVDSRLRNINRLNSRSKTYADVEYHIPHPIIICFLTFVVFVGFNLT